jgi:hypothetical protein
MDLEFLMVPGAGTSLDRAVFARVYLVNFQDYAAMNGVSRAPA